MIKNRYKALIGFVGIMLILYLIPSNLYSAELTTELEEANVASFYGTWKVTELAWYNEHYFVSDSVIKEMQQKINKPIESFVITIDEQSYAESSPAHNYCLDKPQYIFESYDMSSNSEVIYNKIKGCRDYLEILNITDELIDYLIVRDSIKDKMDSGEIDNYYVSTPVFIIVDVDTLLLTSPDFVEIFKCERVAK